MAWTASALDSSLVNAAAADAPLFVARNTLREFVSAKWTNGDSFDAGTTEDITEFDFPAGAAVCPNPYRGTRAQATGVSSFFFLIEAPLNSVFDVLALRLNWAAIGTTDIVVKRADNATGTNEATLCSFSGIALTKRLISLSLGTGNQRFTGSGFIQISFECDSTTPPELGGLYAGQRIILNRKFDRPFDDDPLEISAEEFVARAQNRQRVVQDGPAAIFSGGYVATSSGAFGQDDVENIRQIYRDSRFAADPVLFVQHPSTATASAPHKFWYGYNPKSLRLQHQDFAAYGLNFQFDETKPYREPEVTT